MENKIPGDVNLTESNSQFKENGSSHITEQVTPLFFNLYQSLSPTDTYFCDFSEDYPFYNGGNDLTVTDTVNYTPLFVEYGKLPGFNQSDIDDIAAGNAEITSYLPWIHAVDATTGEVTFSYTSKLTILDDGNDAYYTVNATGQNHYGILSPTAYKGYDTVYTAGATTPDIVAGDDTQYTFSIKPTGGDIIVKAFGLMYNKTILT
jgi:hypothetical protein